MTSFVLFKCVKSRIICAINKLMLRTRGGRDSSVGIAIRYRLNGPVSESRWGGARFSAPIHTDPGAHPASCTMGKGSFSWLKRPGRGADHPPPSSLPRS